MSMKEVVDALLQLLGMLVSWPVIFLCVILLVRRELPAIISKLSERITKAPGGFEFAILQQKVETLSTKVENLEKVAFDPSVALTSELQAKLQSSFDLFQAYLANLGYVSKANDVTVFVDSTLQTNAYYDNRQQRIVLGQPLAQDTDIVFREYAHHVLLLGTDDSSLTADQQAVESGLADYFPCSFNNDPQFGEKSFHLFKTASVFKGKTSIRNLSNDYIFNEASANPEYHIAGEIWGGAFWELRQQFGQNTADKLLFSSWTSLKLSDSKDNFNIDFVKKLLETAQSYQMSDQLDKIKAIFTHRGLKS